MKTLHLNLTTLKSKLLSIFLLVCLVSISGLLTSCDKEDVEPDAPSVKTNSKSDSDELVHQVPTVPILLDGVSVPSSEVTKYNGKRLIYIIDKSFEKDGILRIFTNDATAETYRSQIDSKDKNSAARTAGPPPPAPYITVFLNPNFIGPHLHIQFATPNLAFVFGPIWNNNISSIGTLQNNGRWTRLHNQINFGGNMVWIAPGIVNANLSAIGANNMASSISFF